ncbi:hypothetical protein San01_18950 [Streptomyces angustmyceticus]|uniref:Uncharacterized protein n=1 Tax=Streptomyces angustmyceticus TaxID=285578 RepID=A0A5J4LFH8_9ACTN|nr:hypothetical protein San01_18950 [Streptomyces angustmyceticus]
MDGDRWTGTYGDRRMGTDGLSAPARAGTVRGMSTHPTFREVAPRERGPHGECAPRGLSFLRRRGRVGSPPARCLCTA